MTRNRFRPRIEAIDAGSALVTAMQSGAPREMAEAIRHRFESGSAYLGHPSYSLVCALTNFSLPQRLIHLQKLQEEANLLVRVGKVGTEADADERVKMINWLAVIETALLIGDLAALLAAVERWRNGGDLASEYLQFERVAPTIGRREWRTTKMWHRLLGYRGRSSLSDLGMTSEQGKSFRALLGETVGLAIEGMLWASEFLTPELRRVAIRYRHSFSVLSPASGPIYVASGVSQKRIRAVGESIVVLDIDLTGQGRVLALRATPEDLNETVGAARQIAVPAIVLAGSIMLEADSPAHRGLKAVTDSRALSELEQQGLALYHGWPTDEGNVVSGMPEMVSRNMDPFYRMAPIADLPAILQDAPGKSR